MMNHHLNNLSSHESLLAFIGLYVLAPDANTGNAVYQTAWK